jgi:hypothetical protein
MGSEDQADSAFQPQTSEDQFQTELYRSAGGDDGRQPPRDRIRLSSREKNCVVGQAEVGSVKKIEQFRSELKAGSVAQLRIF